jgi:luciferase-like monooxygenase
MAASIQQQIIRVVSSWPGVSVASHRFGGVEFQLGRRELGHLHGSRMADLPFPVRVRDELIAAGKAEHHHIMPKSGWVTLHIHDVADVDRAIELFRLNYDQPWSTGTMGRKSLLASRP